MELQTLFSIFAGLAGLGVLTGGIGFAYAQFRSGANKAKDDLVTTLKDQLTVEKEITAKLQGEKMTLVNSHQVQITDLTAKIGKLEGLVEANEKRAQEYLTILQGRDPDNQKFMQFIGSVAKEAAEYMRDTAVTLKEIREITEQTNKKLDGIKITKRTKTVQEIKPS